MARLYAGTSGWGYAAWKGSFYPASIRSDGMLGFYAGHFPAVEVNNSGYRMPKPESVTAWRDAVPEDFRFALKAPQQITHMRRLRNIDEPLARFLDLAGLLGARRGPLLFQLPPNMSL